MNRAKHDTTCTITVGSRAPSGIVDRLFVVFVGGNMAVGHLRRISSFLLRGTLVFSPAYQSVTTVRVAATTVRHRSQLRTTEQFVPPSEPISCYMH